MLNKNAFKLISYLPLTAVAAFAQNAVQLNSTNSLALSAPSQSVDGFRVEFRIHDVQTSLQGLDTANLLQLPQGFLIRFMGTSYNGSFSLQDNLDGFTSGQGNILYFDISGRTDLIFRMQRSTIDQAFTAEMWNGDGSGYQSAKLSIDTLNPLVLPSSAYIGGGGTECALDYVRLFRELAPVGTLPFGESTAGLLDVEFERNLLDSSSNHIPVTPTGTIDYVASPVYPPYVSQGIERTLTGSAGQLASQCFPLNNSNAPLIYQWSQVSGPTTLSWSSQTTANPTVSGLTFGSYVLNLTATDSSGVSATSTLKYGDVAVDTTGHVVPPSPYITSIFGPMMPWGVNAWPYFETQHKVLADFFGGLQSTLYADVWDTPLPGTISVTNGSETVTGVGTTFLSTFCNGGNQGYNDATVVVWYPVSGSPGEFGRRGYAVSSCQSNTSLTLVRPWITSPSAAAVSYSYMNNGSIGTWTGGSNNANYYDNVLAFYNLYYRSGIDDYQTYAQTLADRWWTMPWVDQGRDCSDGDGTTCLFPRLQGVTGLITRALDGRPDMWPGLRALIGWDYGFADIPAVGDLREDSYATAFVGLAALLDPDPTSRAAWKTDVTNVIDKLWAPNVLAAGNWTNPSYGFASWNGSSGTVTVTKGSTTVIGNGTQWNSSWFSGNAVWTANNNLTDGDAVAYTATVVSPTELTLNTPYEGPTQTGRGWESNNLVGFGTQPYQLGETGTAFRYAYLATNDSRLPQYLAGIADWFQTEGYRPDARGLWYGRIFPNCEPISSTNEWCSGGDAEQSRYLAGQIVVALTEAYVLAPSSTLGSFGDNIYSAMFGGAGGPGSDGTYVTDIATNGWAMQTDLAKDFGFFYGYGFGSAWPAVTPTQTTAQPGADPTY